MTPEMAEDIMVHLHRMMTTYTIPERWRDDLTGEVMLILCEKPEEELQALEDRGKLYQYIGGIIKRSFRSSTSPFYAKYRKAYTKMETYGTETGTITNVADTEDIYR